MNRSKLTSLKYVFNFWKKRFQAQQIPDAGSSAEYLIAHALGKKTLFGIDPCVPLTEVQQQHAHSLCKLRLSRLPVQYILEEWDFLDLTLKMKPPVLIPRPETEELTMLCMDSLSKLPEKGRKMFLEIGSGSGAISLSLLKKFNMVQGVALDISEDACALTEENARLTGVAERLTVIHGDIQNVQVCDHLQSLGPFCLVVSNPPYISTPEMDSLQEEVAWFEDHRALHGGQDGMHLVREIVLKASQLLQRKSSLWLEVGETHPPLVQAFAQSSHTWLAYPQRLKFVEAVKDLYGKNRFCHLAAL